VNPAAGAAEREASTRRESVRHSRISANCYDAMGPETLMWGSDYPHGDGVSPESSKHIEEQFGHLPPEIARKMVCENAGRFYGLIA
jgi:predicted TIM-barrel fold metal-dependent hydrolase